MQKNLKPFDLEAALQGSAVVTREGKEVTEIVQLKTMAFSNNSLLAVIGGNLYAFNQDGKIYDNIECKNDLFMKPTQVTKWVNIYALASGNFTTGEMFDTQGQAMKEYTPFGEPFSTTQITFEV